MPTINKYTIKEGTSIDDIKTEIESIGLKFSLNNGIVNRSGRYYTCKYLHKDISVDIVFPDDLSTWNSESFTKVMDEFCGQPFMLFYDDDPCESVWVVIEKYNEFMDSLHFLRRVG